MSAEWALVQINCLPHGNECYPTPKTFYILRRFNSEKDARLFWPNDVVHTPPEENDGQHVYQVLWDMKGPLNLDRYIVNDNKISNTAMWLPQTLQQAIDAAPIPKPNAPVSQPILRKKAPGGSYSSLGHRTRIEHHNKGPVQVKHRIAANQNTGYLPPCPQRNA
jgi:hypothetical protein